MTFIFVVNYSSTRADQMKETPSNPVRVWECIILYMLRNQALMESSYLECSPIQPVIKRSFTRKLFNMSLV